MPTYADKDTLLRALTDLHEQTLDGEEATRLFGGAILIRELTARQREAANNAALAENPDQPDNDLYRAMLMQQSVVDPNTGTPYDPPRYDDDGSLLIDPRTRRPLFSVAEVQLLADGRDKRVSTLVDLIMALSALGPAALFRGSDAANGGERDPGAGDPTDGDPPTGDAGARPSDPDVGGALSVESDEDAGADAGSDLVL